MGKPVRSRKLGIVAQQQRESLQRWWRAPLSSVQFETQKLRAASEAAPFFASYRLFTRPEIFVTGDFYPQQGILQTLYGAVTSSKWDLGLIAQNPRYT